MPNVTLDLEAFRARLKRQRVIEFSDVDFLITTLEEHAARVRELTKERNDARAEATAWRESFDGELEGGKQLRTEMDAQEKETIWTAANRVVRENDILKDTLMRIAGTNDLETIQRLVRAAQVKVWGER